VPVRHIRFEANKIAMASLVVLWSVLLALVTARTSLRGHQETAKLQHDTAVTCVSRTLAYPSFR
jgi:hypothetical protein